MRTIDVTNRLVLEVELVPMAGSRFQPTGFPDLGEALFQKPIRDNGHVRWVDALLVDSAQSMANRLEAVGWDSGADQPHPVLEGLPWVRVIDGEGRYLTSSRTEAHRLASAFVKDSTLDGVGMKQVIRERLNLVDDRPLSQREIAAAVFALDPLCLIHGVFFAESAQVWPGQPKITRALTAFVEAEDVRPADSGGVKRDHVRHSLDDAKGGTSEGYGTVPFARREFTAARLTASFTLDRAQLHSYGLGDAATDLLEAIALWEVRSLLDGQLRLRTACDLMPVDEVDLPAVDELSQRIADGVALCQGALGAGAPLDVVWDGGGKRKKA